MLVGKLICLLLCIPLTGCTLCRNVKRTVLDEPSEFSWMGDRKRSVATYRVWADEAWSAHVAAEGGTSSSNAYEIGFKDGFVDYVYLGGSGDPPPVPPRQFWNVSARNSQGNIEATDWFAGYRHGAQVARVEGYRQRAQVPASMFLLGPADEQLVASTSIGAQSAISDHPPELQPELVSPGPPELTPATEPSAEGLPTTDVEPPTLEMPPVDPADAMELPPPTPAEPKNLEPVPQRENVPTNPRESSEIDRLFDAPTPKFDPQASTATERQPIPQGRRAFAAAIKSRRLPSQSPPVPQSRTASRDDSQFVFKAQHVDFNRQTAPPALSQLRQASQRVTAPQPTAIPKSKDDSAEMFRNRPR